MHNIVLLGPVFGLENGSAWSFIGPFFNMILIIAILGLLAYYATKMIKISRARGLRNKTGNVRLVESIAVGAQSMVQLIKAGEKYLVIGVTRERVTLLAELDKEQVEEPYAPEITVPFSKILSRFLPQKDDPQQRDED